jgi:chemotaxis protein methyltransferase CheR
MMQEGNKMSSVIIGSGTLPIRCAEILLAGGDGGGQSLTAVVSADAQVKAWARANDVPLVAPGANLADELKLLPPFDFLFSVVNEHILRDDVLSLPRRLAINYHDAPLPRYAGTHATSWALLNNETYFFRDRSPFDLIARHALPALAERRKGQRRLRIWSAGCSTGQEVYSLAMLFAEAPQQWAGWTIDILGTDVSTACIDRARAGTYSQFEVQRGLGINQMIKWFEECSDGWRAVEALRRPVRFQVHNLLEPAPHPGDFDIVLCRNVMLYLSPDKKTAAFERIAGAMAADGWLMLGAGETVIGQTSKLGADLNARGLYRLIGDGSTVEKRSGDRRAATGA